MSSVPEAPPLVSDTSGKIAPRGRGRPKGQKNGPNAGKVGRPRKDGQPPQKRISNCKCCINCYTANSKLIESASVTTSAESTPSPLVGPVATYTAVSTSGK